MNAQSLDSRNCSLSPKRSLFQRSEDRAPPEEICLEEPRSEIVSVEALNFRVKPEWSDSFRSLYHWKRESQTPESTVVYPPKHVHLTDYPATLKPAIDECCGWIDASKIHSSNGLGIATRKYTSIEQPASSNLMSSFEAYHLHRLLHLLHSLSSPVVQRSSLRENIPQLPQILIQSEYCHAMELFCFDKRCIRCILSVCMVLDKYGLSSTNIHEWMQGHSIVCT